MDKALVDFLQRTMKEQIQLMAEANAKLAANGEYEKMPYFATAISSLADSLRYLADDELSLSS